MVGAGIGGGFWGAGLGGGSMAARGGAKLPNNGKGFAEVPDEMREVVERIQSREPEWDLPSVEFSQRAPANNAHLTMWSILNMRVRTALGLLVVGIVEIAALQSGPLLTQLGIDHGVLAHSLGGLLAAGIGAVLAVVLTASASRVRYMWSGRLAARSTSCLRVRVFSHLQRLSMDYYTNEKSGVIMTRMMSDIEALQRFYQDGIGQFLTQILTMVVVSIVLIVDQPDLAAIVLLLVIPALVALSEWFRRASRRGYGLVRDGIAAVLSDLAEMLQGIRVITAFNRQTVNSRHHRGILRTYQAANNYTARNAGIYGPTSEFIGIAGQFIVLVIGGLMVRRGELSVGELTAFVLYVGTFFQPIQQMVQTYDTFQSAQAAVVKLRELLATTPNVEEAAGATELPPMHGGIKLEHVSFGYTRDDVVLHDVSLDLHPGQTVALVGPTGAGKSTIAKLVSRFYDPTSGRVTIDGRDLRAVTFESLRRQLGVVPQEPFLFAGTIGDNIRFGRPDATDDEVDIAVRTVGLAELIDSLPDRLETPVHERGVSLSAGERQLIALARAFLTRPRVLILDEATSNLDLQSERQVEEALDHILEGRTAIIVAHRLTTAARADRIVVVADGGIVEDGSHEELLARDGRYAAMFAIWAEAGRLREQPAPRLV
jgi:ATP-binding cassette subfamily B protein